MRLRRQHQFRIVLCGHKAVEAAAVCVVLMVQGHLADVTLAHLVVAAKTGLLAVSPALGMTFTRYAHYFASKWASSAFFGMFTFAADAIVHGSHYPGAYTEAALTGAGAFVFSLAVAHSRIGRAIDHLAEDFLQANRRAPVTSRPQSATPHRRPSD